VGNFTKAIELLQWQSNKLDTSAQFYRSRLEYTHLLLLLEQHELQQCVSLLNEIVLGFGGISGAVGADVRLQTVHVSLSEMDQVLACVCACVCGLF